jgi:hypothetical protein
VSSELVPSQQDVPWGWVDSAKVTLELPVVASQ